MKKHKTKKMPAKRPNYREKQQTIQQEPPLEVLEQFRTTEDEVEEDDDD